MNKLMHQIHLAFVACPRCSPPAAKKCISQGPGHWHAVGQILLSSINKHELHGHLGAAAMKVSMKVFSKTPFK